MISTIATLFPYTTLFRSGNVQLPEVGRIEEHAPQVRRRPDGETGRELLRNHRAVHRHHTGGDRRTEERGHVAVTDRSEEHTSELQSLRHLVCRLLLEKKK